MTTTNTAAILILRDFAKTYGEIRFAHLCTAALAALAGDVGEEWALERVAPAIAKWNSTTMAGKRVALRLAAVRCTDTTRPDGAIARSVEI